MIMDISMMTLPACDLTHDVDYAHLYRMLSWHWMIFFWVIFFLHFILLELQFINTSCNYKVSRQYITMQVSLECVILSTYLYILHIKMILKNTILKW